MDSLIQGVVLMIIGMASVFAFLVLMILAINSSAGFFRKYAHLFPEEHPAVPKKTTLTNPDVEIAVALAAIRAKRG